MGDVRQELKEKWPEAMDDLRTMRDRIRLKIHLAKMDVQSTWQTVEPKIDDLAARFASATEGKLQELEDAAKRLRDEVKGIEAKLE